MPGLDPPRGQSIDKRVADDVPHAVERRPPVERVGDGPQPGGNRRGGEAHDGQRGGAAPQQERQPLGDDEDRLAEAQYRGQADQRARRARGQEALPVAQSGTKGQREEHRGDGPRQLRRCERRVRPAQRQDAAREQADAGMPRKRRPDPVDHPQRHERRSGDDKSSGRDEHGRIRDAACDEEPLRRVQERERVERVAQVPRFPLPAEERRERHLLYFHVVSAVEAEVDDGNGDL